MKLYKMLNFINYIDTNSNEEEDDENWLWIVSIFKEYDPNKNKK